MLLIPAVVAAFLSLLSALGFLHCRKSSWLPWHGLNEMAMQQSKVQPKEDIPEIPCVEVSLPPIPSKPITSRAPDKDFEVAPKEMDMGKSKNSLKGAKKPIRVRSVSLPPTASFTSVDMPDWTIHSNDLYGEHKIPVVEECPENVVSIPEEVESPCDSPVTMVPKEISNKVDIEMLSEAIARQMAKLHMSAVPAQGVVTGYPSPMYCQGV